MAGRVTLKSTFNTWFRERRGEARIDEAVKAMVDRPPNSRIIGSKVIYRQPHLILTGLVEEVDGDYSRVRLESPWGYPFPFTDWVHQRTLG